MTLAPDNRVTYIGRTNHRNSDRLFGIRQTDRRMHMLVLGKTGMGKSHLLRLFLEQDARARQGFALFDPHGELARFAKTLAEAINREDVVYVDIAEQGCGWRFNPFGGVSPEERSLAAAGVVETFKKLWLDDWGPRLEHLLRNTVYLLLETEGASFAMIPELLTNRGYRLDLARSLSNDAVREFWTNEYDKYSPALRAAVIAPLQNKIGALLTDPVLRRFFGTDGSSLDLRRIMDRGQILIINLDKGRLGESAASVLGSLLLSHIALAGLSRTRIAERERRDFAVFLDEFQTFTTLALANMLSELRKYRVSLFLVTQYLAAVDAAIRDAVLGNVGTLISFRIGATDAAIVAREMGLPTTPNDLAGLRRYDIFVRLLISGEPSRAFTATVPASLSGD